MKKQQPLAVLKAIEPILLSIDHEAFNLVKDGPELLLVKDADANSDFFFEISKHLQTNHGTAFNIRFSPKNESDVSTDTSLVILANIQGFYTNWVKRVRGYAEVKSKYDDPILKQYAEEFYNELVSADEDATTVAFNFKQQLLLDGALDQVIEVLASKKDEHNEEAIDKLIGEAQEIQNTLSEHTKQETLTKLSKLFAKVQKSSFKWIKDVYPIIQKEIIGAIVKTAVTAGVGLAAAAGAHLLHP